MSGDTWLGPMDESTIYVFKYRPQFLRKKSLIGGHHPDSGVLNIYLIEKGTPLISCIPRIIFNKVVEYRFHDRVKKEYAIKVLNQTFELIRQGEEIGDLVNNEMNSWDVFEATNLPREEFKAYSETVEDLSIPDMHGVHLPKNYFFSDLSRK